MIIFNIFAVSIKSFSMYGSSAQITRMANPGPRKQDNKGLRIVWSALYGSIFLDNIL